MASEESRHKERVLVRAYRARLNDLETAQQDGTAGRDVGDLHRRLVEADDLYQRSELPGPQVAELDGELVAGLSVMLCRGVRGAGSGPGAFQPAEFAGRLTAAVGQAESSPSPVAWASLGRLTAPLLVPCPGLRLLFGTLPAPNAPPPERKQRTPRARANQLAAAVAPDQVADAGEPGATPRQINRLESILTKLCKRNQGPICFFTFAYHPTDFGITVENVFHTSILVKMSKARVFLRDGLPVIEPNHAGAAGAAGAATAAAAAEKHQVLVKVEHDSWRQIVQLFGIKKPLIPPEANGAQ